MRRAAQTVLVLLAVGCSLILSATATVALAASAGVPGWAHLAAVGVIEVVLTVGTWLWISDPELRREAAGAVVLASAVAGYAGVHAYGAFGLVGPVSAIVTTHLVARAWRRKETPVQDPGAHRAAACRLDSTEGAGTAGLTPRPDPAPPMALDAGLEPTAPADEEDPQLAQVRAIVAKGGGRGTVADELGVTPNQARSLITKAKAAA
jgi:hypothetical protein